MERAEPMLNPYQPNHKMNTKRKGGVKVQLKVMRQLKQECVYSTSKEEITLG